MSALRIEFQRGNLWLPELDLWLDPHEPRTGPEKVFISHAHSDHIEAHREVILSAPTAKLMQVRVPGKRLEHILAFGETSRFDNHGKSFDLTLLPAGHIFGSAMGLIETEGRSLLYTGDFKLRRGLSAESCEPRRADTLIMETTYGRSRYVFPPAEDVLKGVIRFCREALDNDETAVLLGYSLGKSQELLCGLAEAGFPLMLHGAVFRLTQIYEQFGQCFPKYERYEAGSARGKVLLCPPNVINSAMLRNLGKTRTAILTGWAVDPNCRFRYQCDAAFPLSDHADFSDLIKMVKQVEPKMIYTLHGFAADFAQTLRGLGYDARALSEDEQLALELPNSHSRSKRETSRLKTNNLAPSAAAAASSPSPPLEERAGERRPFDTAALNSMTVRSETPVPRTESSPSPPQEERVGERRPFTPNSPNSASAGFVSAPVTSFHDFALTCSRISSDPRKLEKIRLLGEYLRSLKGESLGFAAAWFTGRPFPSSHNKMLQLGWAVLRDALCAIGELDEAALHQIYLKHSDSGETAMEVLQHKPSQPNLSIAQVNELFLKLQATRGPLAKTPVLIAGLEACTPIEAKYLVKIISGDLRIGLKEGLVEEAVAFAFAKKAEAVRQANLLLGDIAEVAKLAADDRLSEATLTPFRPVKFMLASPEETAQALWERVRAWHEGTSRSDPDSASPAIELRPLSTETVVVSPSPPLEERAGERRPFDTATPISTAVPPASRVSAQIPNLNPNQSSAADASPAVNPQVWIEDKYDGIRCQLHKVGLRVALYSRDLKDITTTFLELSDSARGLSDDFILDGEIVAMRGESVLPFAELQKRLGRRQDDLFMREEVPIKLIVFDLLWLNGKSFLQEPLRERRRNLESLAALPGSFRLANITRAESAEEIEAAFAAARSRDNEGLMIKEPGSFYTPGRRGLAWLKLKKAFATLDCIVVGAEYGHGKRSKVLSDYTFAVRDDHTGELKTIGKAYSGLTDVEIAQLTEHFLKRATRQHGRYFEVEPDTVLEIAFDRLQASNRHSSGYAMRFPRIVRVRTDKSLSEIDTVATARALAGKHRIN
jgi:DNA ligase-1